MNEQVGGGDPVADVARRAALASEARKLLMALCAPVDQVISERVLPPLIGSSTASPGGLDHSARLLVAMLAATASSALMTWSRVAGVATPFQPFYPLSIEEADEKRRALTRELANLLLKAADDPALPIEIHHQCDPATGAHRTSQWGV